MKYYIALVIVFVIGWLSSSMYVNLFSLEEIPKNIDYVEGIAPSDHIKERDVEVYRDKVILNLPYKNKEYSWSRYARTGSMNPVFNESANGLEILKPDIDMIRTGDIISYKHGNEIIVHRVINIGYDENGWYAVTKGDANKEADPYLVRINDIEALTIAVLY